MAVSFHTTTSTSYLHSGSGVSPPSPRVLVGFKLQSPGSFRVAKPNSHFDFRTKVIGSTHSWTNGSKPTRCRIENKSKKARVVLLEPREDEESFFLRERILFIDEEIDEDYSNVLLETILFLNSANSDKPLLLIINCFGGDVQPSLAIYDTLLNLNSPLATRCLGTAANMAAFLLVAGDKGQRFSFPHSTIMLEPLFGTANTGQADDYSNEANELVRTRNYLFDQLAIHTGQPVEKIHKDFEGTRSFSAQEALEYGLIDHIIRPPPLAPDRSKRVRPRWLNYD